MILTDLAVDRALGAVVGLVAADALAGGAPPRGRFDRSWSTVAGSAVEAFLDGAAAPSTGPSATSVVRACLLGLRFADADEVAAAAREWGGGDDDADAAVLWSLAVRGAVLTGGMDAAAGLPWIPDDRRSGWLARLSAAEEEPSASSAPPHDPVGRAWSAIARSSGLIDRVSAALRGPADSRSVTVALTGALAGASAGYSRIPACWRRGLHGPLRGADTTVHGLVSIVAERFAVDPAPVRERFAAVHPHDDAVVLVSPSSAAEAWSADRKTVVVVAGADPAAADELVAATGADPADVLAFWIPDRPGAIPDPGRVLADAADALARARAQGASALVVGAGGAVATVAAAYAARHRGVPAPRALESALAAVGGAWPHHELWAAALVQDPADPVPRDDC